MDKKYSAKELAWKSFSHLVSGHIQNYAVKQYGPDIKENTDVEDTKDCLKYIAKYRNRHGAERRGRIEELRDLIKIAHFAQIGFDMMNPTPEEIEALFLGERES